MQRLRSLVLGDVHPRLLPGVLTAVVSVAVATGLIYALRQVAPVVSLGVVYLPGVLVVSARWGLGLGLFTALLSTAAFNFFHISPTGRFTIDDSRNWVALAAFTTVAVLASAISKFARDRALEAEARERQADLAAELARVILGGADLRTASATAAERVAEALDLRSVGLEPGDVEPPRGRQAIGLREDDRVLGTLLVPERLPAETMDRLRTDVVPRLETLLAIAKVRDDLQAETVETAAVRRSDEIKTSLLRAVSHDLRTPLTSIVTAGHALHSRDLSPEEHDELADTVVSEADRLADLVQKLLDLSRLQAGAANPHPTLIDLEEVLASVVEQAGGNVVLQVDPGLPLIQADAPQLERAFANLVENAVRHSEGRQVSVRAREVNKRLRVRVVDQGRGIPPAEQARIFEPFVSGDRGRGHTGSGLGLAIAKGFIDANGGTLTVESLPGQGTSFVVAFPLP
jgi:two-component system, OmpR family, sensor histidine kinase KdpD